MTQGRCRHAGRHLLCCFLLRAGCGAQVGDDTLPFVAHMLCCGCCLLKLMSVQRSINCDCVHWSSLCLQIRNFVCVEA